MKKIKFSKYSLCYWQYLPRLQAAAFLFQKCASPIPGKGVPSGGVIKDDSFEIELPVPRRKTMTAMEFMVAGVLFRFLQFKKKNKFNDPVFLFTLFKS